MNGRVSCKKCGKTLSRKDALFRHKRLIHSRKDVNSLPIRQITLSESRMTSSTPSLPPPPPPSSSSLPESSTLVLQQRPTLPTQKPRLLSPPPSLVTPSPPFTFNIPPNSVTVGPSACVHLKPDTSEKNRLHANILTTVNHDSECGSHQQELKGSSPSTEQQMVPELPSKQYTPEERSSVGETSCDLDEETASTSSEESGPFNHRHCLR
ncbi:mucin-7-like [Haliotis rufescens]|uniref:mucin-7-like n=1 Tax=Haliotis rufescens TaxID=6454 RepID=UPI00201F2CEB|nr:mucin-7-like [Haliotis rufescens]